MPFAFSRSKMVGKMLAIKEAIVVEGRDDLTRLRTCVDAHIITTHGFGITEATYREIAYAVERTGVIVLTDPDYAGEQIRTRINRRIPGVKHAFITREEGTRADNVGVENASCEAILEALSKVRTLSEKQGDFEPSDLVLLGLSGHPDAVERRNLLGKKLGIGYANARGFLERLNHYGITRAELADALDELGW